MVHSTILCMHLCTVFALEVHVFTCRPLYLYFQSVCSYHYLYAFASYLFYLHQMYMCIQIPLYLCLYTGIQYVCVYHYTCICILLYLYASFQYAYMSYLCVLPVCVTVTCGGRGLVHPVNWIIPLTKPCNQQRNNGRFM